MDIDVIEPSGDGECAVQVKPVADGVDPELRCFRTREDGERWIAKQKAWMAARSMRPGLPA